MLERYYKSKQEFEEILDKNYNPSAFLDFIHNLREYPTSISRGESDTKSVKP